MLLETNEPPTYAETLTTEVVVPAPEAAARPSDTMVEVPEVEPVLAVAPETCVNCHVTLELVLMVADAIAVAKGEVFKSFKAVTLVLGLTLRVTRAQTS